MLGHQLSRLLRVVGDDHLTEHRPHQVVFLARREEIEQLASAVAEMRGGLLGERRREVDVGGQPVFYAVSHGFEVFLDRAEALHVVGEQRQRVFGRRLVGPAGVAFFHHGRQESADLVGRRQAFVTRIMLVDVFGYQRYDEIGFPFDVLITGDEQQRAAALVRHQLVRDVYPASGGERSYLLVVSAERARGYVARYHHDRHGVYGQRAEAVLQDQRGVGIYRRHVGYDLRYV